MVDVSEQLDQLVVAYLRGRCMRVVTRNQPVLDAIYEQFTAHRKVVDRRGRHSTERTETFELQQRPFGKELACLSGLLPRLVTICKDNRVAMKVVDVVKEQLVTNAIEVEPLEYRGWDAVQGGLRDWQREALPAMQRLRFGRFKVSTGGGKSRLIAIFCKLAYRARILVTTFNRSDIENLYKGILQEGVDVQIFKGSRPKVRVVCATTGTLQNLRGQEFDVVIGDEIHEHATQTCIKNLWTVDSYRIFGFSANQNDRADGANLWIEGFYGPVVQERTYQENRLAGDVCHIRVTPLSTSGTHAVKSRSNNVRDRLLITQNHSRNREIAAIARQRVEAGRQVLILVKTTEHALQIRYWLPEAIAVFKTATPDRWEQLTRLNITRPGEQPGYNDKQLQEVQEKFRSRHYMVVIANSVWFKGKDFPSLDVVVRGDAISTAVANTQLSGRLSRTYEGKPYGELIDCIDAFDSGLSVRWHKRRRFYKSQGWEIGAVGGSGS